MKPHIKRLMYVLLIGMTVLSVWVFSNGSQLYIGLLLVFGTPVVVFAIAALLLDRATLEAPKSHKKSQRK